MEEMCATVVLNTTGRWHGSRVSQIVSLETATYVMFQTLMCFSLLTYFCFCQLFGSVYAPKVLGKEKSCTVDKNMMSWEGNRSQYCPHAILTLYIEHQ